MENATTGKFIRVNARPKLKQNENDEGDMAPDVFRNFIDVVNTLLSTLFVFSQGILGGLSFLLFFATYVSHSTSNFLGYYSQISSSIQHIYFVFTTLALIASLDKLAKDRLQGWDMRMDGRKQKLLDATLFVCYLVAFIGSLVNAQMDDLIYYSEARIPGWYEQGWDSSFQKKLNQWHAFNILRIIGGVLGWVLISLEVRPYQFSPQLYYEDEREEILLMQNEPKSSASQQRIY
eukprot:TRINITY_DN10295_c0_g1_i2.p1 TRINITY_DN10295_c0_g1~~TRINITY_DN10295_c0_g1_i2.p1  ORF type:complete len:250 (-),score=13.85 TRINITY_DN10295_c0_g1_i2:9-710(-)